MQLFSRFPLSPELAVYACTLVYLNMGCVLHLGVDKGRQRDRQTGNGGVDGINCLVALSHQPVSSQWWSIDRLVAHFSQVLSFAFFKC